MQPDKPKGFRKHWTTVVRLADEVWLCSCACGEFQLEVTGRKGDAVEEAKAHQSLAEYRERVSA